MNSAKGTKTAQVSEFPLIGAAEQYLFDIENPRERADKLKGVLVPKLNILLDLACDLIGEIYGTDTLSICRKATTPAHRSEAKKTKLFDMATAGLALKGHNWFFQQRFECTSDRLYVILFGLRGIEGNPIVKIMKKYQKEVTQLLGFENYRIISSATKLSDEYEQLGLTEISKLKMVTEREWGSTYVEGIYLSLPIQEIDSALPVVYDFVRIFPIFRAAANLRLGKDDCFKYYVESFWTWQSQLQIQEPATAIEIFPDEVDSTETFTEGSVRKVLVNTYERDPQARKQCIEHYGLSCSVCNFDFGKTFGELGKGFIHVHHLRPISEIAQEYEVDPVEDLRPVCPNCHAMIHRRSPPFSIEEMKGLLKSNSIED